WGAFIYIKPVLFFSFFSYLLCTAQAMGILHNGDFSLYNDNVQKRLIDGGIRSTLTPVFFSSMFSQLLKQNLSTDKYLIFLQHVQHGYQLQLPAHQTLQTKRHWLFFYLHLLALPTLFLYVVLHHHTHQLMFDKAFECFLLYYDTHQLIEYLVVTPH